MKNVSVIVPSLNPDVRLENVVKGLLEQGFSDIILVDDGSLAENKSFFPCLEGVTLLTHEVNRGKGAAIKTAIKYMIENRPDSIGAITCDGDGQHTAKDTKRVAEEMINTGEFILGSRDFSLENVPFRSRLGNRLSSLALMLCSGQRITDTQTGLRAIPAKVFKDMVRVEGERFEYETNVLLELKNMKIRYREIKISTLYIDQNKSSHFRPLQDSLRIMSLMFKYVASSVIAFLADIVIFTLLHSCLLLGITLSTIIARLVSSLVNFVINKKLVFKSDTPLISSISKYSLLVVCIMLLSAFLTGTISNIMNISENSFIVTWIKAAVDCILFIINFYIQKHWIFKRNKT